MLLFYAFMLLHVCSLQNGLVSHTCTLKLGWKQYKTMKGYNGQLDIPLPVVMHRSKIGQIEKGIKN